MSITEYQKDELILLKKKTKIENIKKYNLLNKEYIKYNKRMKAKGLLFPTYKVKSEKERLKREEKYKKLNEEFRPTLTPEEKKEKDRERLKKWQKANPEKCRQNTNKWEAKNPEKKAEIIKKQLEKGAQKTLERTLKFIEDNKHRITWDILEEDPKRTKNKIIALDNKPKVYSSEKRKEQYKKHREKILKRQSEYQREYREQHPEIIKMTLDRKIKALRNFIKQHRIADYYSIADDISKEELITLRSEMKSNLTRVKAERKLRKQEQRNKLKAHLDNSPSILHNIPKNNTLDNLLNITTDIYIPKVRTKKEKPTRKPRQKIKKSIFQKIISFFK